MAKTLTFEQLSLVNYRRCTTAYKHRLDLRDWTLPEWTNAVAGEVGELCNVAKKIRRIQTTFGITTDGSLEDLYEQLGNEAADVVIYLDLVMRSAGLDLAEVIARKFNLKSEEVNSPYKLRLAEYEERAA